MSVSLWVDLGVPLGAAAIAAAAALGGTWSGGRTEKSHWLREQRQIAFAALITAGEAHIAEPPEASWSSVRKAAASVLVIGTESIVELASEFANEASTYNKARAAHRADPTPETKSERLARRDVYVTARNAFAKEARSILAG